MPNDTTTDWTEDAVLKQDILVAVTTDGCGHVTVFAPLAGLEPIEFTSPLDEEGAEEEEHFTERVVEAVREQLLRMFVTGR